MTITCLVLSTVSSSTGAAEVGDGTEVGTWTCPSLIWFTGRGRVDEAKAEPARAATASE